MQRFILFAYVMLPVGVALLLISANVGLRRATDLLVIAERIADLHDDAVRLHDRSSPDPQTLSSRQESVHERIDALEAESRVHVAQSSRMQNLIALSGIVIVFVGLLIIVLDARRRLFAAASAVTGSPKGEASERKDII